MAETSPGPTEPLDVERILYLARLMKRYDLTSLDLADGRVQIRMRRRGPEAALMAPSMAPQPAAIGPVAHPIAPAAPSPPGQVGIPPAPTAEKTIVIESPMVGTYYTSRAPDAPPLVTVGSVV